MPSHRTTYLARCPDTAADQRRTSLRLELDEDAAISVRLNDEGAAAVLRVSFRVTDVEQLMSWDGPFAGWLELFDQTHYDVDAV
jgi:hypothetical protein